MKECTCTCAMACAYGGWRTVSGALILSVHCGIWDLNSGHQVCKVSGLTSRVVFAHTLFFSPSVCDLQ